MPASAANIAGHLAPSDCRAGPSNSPARLSLCCLLLLAVATPQAATAAVPPLSTSQPLRGEAVDDFYAARDYRPLWIRQSADPAWALIDLLHGARIDGLDPDLYRLLDLERAVQLARFGNPADIDRADRMLSEAFIAFVRDLKRTPKGEMIWVDTQLLPAAASPRKLLDKVAAAPSPEAYLGNMAWMNPVYAALRQALANGAGSTPAERDLIRLNLERARALPAPAGKYIIVNATTAQLSMYENGRLVDSMRVVVGKPANPTPMMAALIRFISLNPYWNVPADLAAERVAPHVVKEGHGYLAAKGYQLLSSWDADAQVVSPDTVDWAAVADGRTQVRLRQLPGPANAMGKMKFMFPNAQGIYLHDTPDKNLLGEEARMFSGGCVRLEDAPRLAEWLYEGNAPTTTSTRPEQLVDLPTPVPVYLTYLTAIPGEDGIAYLPDVYNRDRAALAALDEPRVFASR